MGLGARDEPDANSDINDDYHISYLREHIRAMGDAIADGIPVIGYITWGCIDLVAASTGEMSKRYALSMSIATTKARVPWRTAGKSPSGG